ncbi:2,3-diaminopropionate biosynthesis protein SbnA [Streptomyces sp. NBC_00257]|uniref:2,3-diaminopropionate biosynthesis protein SbnA n=1 Tax=unclassified Streptomyces TaxID=2593676 RepID=UPI00225A5094|nr:MULTISPECIES: 2,3-diaminopropionate biosynthesis protein SbnA [unclassified Streptomyces]WTB60917.1 2,3-diaminopropionate biosynthesis protein SbnA [Streptomyces sp. NBC_00826]WTH96058.1 2,3-diaminopropionate biosynthesis protein SbnA [Streptomyces sp. NBC_00825]WTI04918.1 2,3-diaminopropionate biosynthesis protein SbnA [Streptomyces sp. NBC_00822]MCX4870440.1 2,3-diaminopropionate biosynthesis protein SbnA [Streptomyces sp. NBC_00906]MCX4902083.1 2,3-diaminopropionate biosynthesis protein 
MARTEREPETGLKGILSTVGGTPLVELERLMPGFTSRVFAKVERFNPGGSVKDRSALNMVATKIRSGELVPGRSTVIESSSGNLAIGLAQICGYYGLRLVCVVDTRTTRQNIAILRAYGAEVEIISEPDPATGELLSARLHRVAELVATTPDAHWPDQYANPLNRRAHETTMGEIAEALDGKVDQLVVAAGTSGTLGGCAEYIRRHGLGTTVNAVDALGSVLFDSPVDCARLVPGHGASVAPKLLRRADADRVVHVGDLDCVVGCRTLVRREAILAGGSSGAVVAALTRLAPGIPPGSNVVIVLPDGGDRYLDTIYDDTWVQRHFGDVAHLWDGPSDAGFVGQLADIAQ